MATQGRKGLGQAKGGKVATASFRKVHAEVERLRRTIRRHQYSVGAALLQIRDEKLWAQGGYSGFVAYLGSLDASVATLYRCMNRAMAVPLAIAESYDAEKVDVGLALLERRKVKTISVEAFEKLRVTVERDGVEKKVRFAQASAAELEAELRREKREALPPLPAETQQVLARLEQKLNAGAGALGDMSVRRRGSKSVALIEVPVERLEEFLSRFQ